MTGKAQIYSEVPRDESELDVVLHAHAEPVKEGPFEVDHGRLSYSEECIFGDIPDVDKVIDHLSIVDIRLMRIAPIMLAIAVGSCVAIGYGIFLHSLQVIIWSIVSLLLVFSGCLSKGLLASEGCCSSGLDPHTCVTVSSLYHVLTSTVEPTLERCRIEIPFSEIKAVEIVEAGLFEPNHVLRALVWIGTKDYGRFVAAGIPPPWLFRLSDKWSQPCALVVEGIRDPYQFKNLIESKRSEETIRRMKEGEGPQGCVVS